MQPKILLVDDRADNIMSLESILEPDGYQFARANSGRQALKILLSEYDFALILMDVQMPNLNGFETAAMIYEREKLRHIPIIFITANHYGEENIFKGYKTGAVDYIYKPINPELVRVKVSVFVDLYKKTHQLIAQERYLIAMNKSLEMEVNERKLSEEKIRQLNETLLDNIDKLESANKELDNFAYMASHDLQEPLRKIRIFCDRLVTKYQPVLDDDGKLNIGKIQKACERMQNLIQDILTFSKLTMEKKFFINSNLNTLINEVLAEVEGAISEKKAAIFVDELPSIPANPGLIRPLFYNLVSNALKYSKKDEPPVIKIRAEMAYNDDTSRKDKSKYCRIIFEDNGIGFDQQYAEQIFGMFKRLHHKTEYDGTGIGLAICKKIVEEHNGFITAQSKLNEGSVFIVSLPMKQPAEQVAEVSSV
jgi:signal transduction histidine kinase